MTHSPFTCQLCARAQKAKYGFVAHHGYAQPDGQGVRHGPCRGSRGRPYEHSADLIPGEIAFCKRAIAEMRKTLAGLKANPPASYMRQDPTSKKPKMIQVSRPEGFNPKTKAEPGTYGALYASNLAHVAARISGEKDRLEFLTKRLAAWVPPKDPVDI